MCMCVVLLRCVQQKAATMKTYRHEQAWHAQMLTSFSTACVQGTSGGI